MTLPKQAALDLIDFEKAALEVSNLKIEDFGLLDEKAIRPDFKRKNLIIADYDAELK